MKQFNFDASSHFFAEILTFSIPLIGFIGVIRFPELKAQIDYLITRYNLRRQGVPMPAETIPNIVIPDNLAVIGQVVTSTLISSQRFASEMQEGHPVSTLSWVDADLVSPKPGKLVETPFPLETALAPIGQVTVGAAFERVKDVVEASGVKTRIHGQLSFSIFDIVGT
jgi:hypothetical protein